LTKRQKSVKIHHLPITGVTWFRLE